LLWGSFPFSALLPLPPPPPGSFPFLFSLKQPRRLVFFLHGARPDDREGQLRSFFFFFSVGPDAISIERSLRSSRATAGSGPPLFPFFLPFFPFPGASAPLVLEGGDPPLSRSRPEDREIVATSMFKFSSAAGLTPQQRDVDPLTLFPFPAPPTLTNASRPSSFFFPRAAFDRLSGGRYSLPSLYSHPRRAHRAAAGDGLFSFSLLGAISPQIFSRRPSRTPRADFFPFLFFFPL